MGSHDSGCLPGEAGPGGASLHLCCSLAGGPARGLERTESRSISSRFLLQAQSPPIRYLSRTLLS